MPERTPLFLTFVVAGAFVATMLLTQPYSYRDSRPSPWTAYAEPAKAFLQAALRKDSAKLASLSRSDRAVAWGLAAGRRYPDSIAIWAREATVWSGYERDDTVEVLLSSGSDVCYDHPIWLRLVGDVGDAKVVEAGTECFDPK